MKKVLGICGLLIVGLLLAVASASAGVADMQFNYAVGPSYQGVYSYPYDLTVNGQHEWLMCIGYNEHIINGETWQANVVSVASLNSQQYDAAAWLYLQALADNGADPSINAAAWYVMEPGALPLTAGAQSWFDLATSQVYPDGSFANVYLYEPIDGTQSWAGELPQPFLGSTPEPGTLLLIGGGLLVAWSQRKLIP